MYPEGFATTISVTGVSEGLCGGARPGHFDGVATVVTKLFLQCDADRAYFGEKDYQQLQVVTRLCEDLDLNTEIVGCPTIREEDGLAMSSRNLRLGAGPRKTAPMIAQVLEDAARVIARGGHVEQTIDKAKNALLSAGFDSIDYLELRSVPDLKLMTSADRPSRLFLAAWLDGVRLIDNVFVADLASVGKSKDRPLEPA